MKSRVEDRFVGVCAFEGVETVDRRRIADMTTTWRVPPLPLAVLAKDAPSAAHGGSAIFGAILAFWREESVIRFAGRFENGWRGHLCAPSRDGSWGCGMDAVDAEFPLDPLDPGGALTHITRLRIVGVTVYPTSQVKPAWPQCRIRHYAERIPVLA